MAPLPGTPKAMVGMRSPPSLELFAAPGPRTPRTSPLPNPSRSRAPRALWTAWAYAIHWATPPPAPGRMPTNTPMAEQRATSQKWRNVSLMPSSTPARRASGGRSPAIEVRRIARSTSSGMAKMPTRTGTRSRPSQRYMRPMSKRRAPDWRSCPIVERSRPKSPMAKPRSWPRRPSPLSDVMHASPITETMNSSGEPNVSTSGRTIGTDTANVAAPITAPSSELMRAAPSARPASPRLAIGCPSTTVAAERASPGTPNRIDVMSPVVAATECMPRRKANASTGVILNTNGSIRARVAAPPIPGRRPTTNPVPMPTSMRLKAFHCRIRTSPSKNASSIAAPPGPVYTTGNAGGKMEGAAAGSMAATRSPAPQGRFGTTSSWVGEPRAGDPRSTGASTAWGLARLTRRLPSHTLAPRPGRRP